MSQRVRVELCRGDVESSLSHVRGRQSDDDGVTLYACQFFSANQL